MGGRINSEVLIVGGGLVGLTLAIDLARRGIEVTIAETRAGGEPPSEGERKTGTALLADIQMSTELMEGFRPGGKWLPCAY